MTEARLRLAPQISRATIARHATATIVLHWGTVAALVIMVAAIYLRDFTEDKAIRQLLLDVHRQFGLLVMIGVPLRILARYWLGFADQTSTMARLLRWAAAGTHVVLYASLIALPVLGWAATSAKGIHLALVGVVPLPSLATPDPDVADALLDYHQWFGWALFGLVAMHALAALWHHFVRRDGVLAAMLPHQRPAATMRPIRVGVVDPMVSVRKVIIAGASTPQEPDMPTIDALESRRGYPLRRLLRWERSRSTAMPPALEPPVRSKSAAKGDRDKR
jgi:cytochrome b561